MSLTNKLKEKYHLLKAFIYIMSPTLIMPLFSNYYLHHNIKYDASYAIVYEKIDGICSYTRIEDSRNRSFNKLELKKSTGFFTKHISYFDIDDDNHIDVIWTSGTRKTRGWGRYIYRDSTNIETFLEADNLLAEEKERFGLK